MSPTGSPIVSVVVPVFRTAWALPELARRTRRTLQRHGLDHELIFVDDASPDDTRQAVERLLRTDPAVGALGLGRNVGQHRAVVVGLGWCRGEWVVVMDGDLQDPPEAIPLLLGHGALGFDAVFAGRRGRYEEWHRLLTSRLFKAILGRLCGVPVDAGMFVALHRALARRLAACPASRPSIVALAGLYGHRVTSIPVVRQPRPRGDSAYSEWERLRAGLEAISFAARWRRRPDRPPMDSGAPLKPDWTRGVCAGQG